MDEETAELFAPQEHGTPCRGCRRAHLAMACAACGQRTAVVALASTICRVEYCRACWQTLQAVRLGTRALQAWPVGDYVRLQAHREQQRPLAVSAAVQKPRRVHRRTKAETIAPQALPWCEDEMAQGGAA
jgi:hypothetical protein